MGILKKETDHAFFDGARDFFLKTVPGWAKTALLTFKKLGRRQNARWQVFFSGIPQSQQRTRLVSVFF